MLSLRAKTLALSEILVLKKLLSLQRLALINIVKVDRSIINGGFQTLFRKSEKNFNLKQVFG